MTDARGINPAFGQRVRAAMAVARVSRQDVARACKISPQAVQRWCDGTAYPESSKLMTFCEMTGCSVEWLLWPHPVDVRSTDWAINGVHIKHIVRATLDDLAQMSTAGLAEVARMRAEPDFWAFVKFASTCPTLSAVQTRAQALLEKKSD